jgi:hypothetical protein
VILTTNVNPVVASNTLQSHLNRIQTWTQKWKIKINETKSAQVNFTLKKEQCPSLYMNRTEIPTTTSACTWTANSLGKTILSRKENKWS